MKRFLALICVAIASTGDVGIDLPNDNRVVIRAHDSGLLWLHYSWPVWELDENLNPFLTRDWWDHVLLMPEAKAQ